MDTKSLRVELKDADEDKGEVTAVFSTLDVEDKHGDVTLKGAFEDGAEVLISAYQHESWMGSLPVGKGVIRETKTEAVFNGKFWLDTQTGADHFRAVKHAGDLMEWSYGYDVVKASFGEHEDRSVRFLEKLKVHEVSPVLIGAGVNTRTLATKSAGMKFTDEGLAVVAAVESYIDRAADVMAKRQEKGKALGAESTEVTERVHAALKRLAELLDAEPTPENEADIAREIARLAAFELG
ncbi:HK97 family phage prohead protease [Actinophytocola sp. NPDC049390]|uniref:HK97 family phage prohead protease n=1 Tax=Actinophytocola sp. NPDC049390 TaxID=3363894 RepID=UPI0037B2E5D4